MAKEQQQGNAVNVTTAWGEKLPGTVANVRTAKGVTLGDVTFRDPEAADPTADVLITGAVQDAEGKKADSWAYPEQAAAVAAK